MSTQLSQTTRSNIGTFYFTSDGTITGVPLVVLWEEDDWSRYRNNGGDVLVGEEYQSVDIGGATGKANWPITLKIQGMKDAAWAAMFAQRDVLNATYAATFNLAATTNTGAERQVTFTKLRYLSVKHASAPDYRNRFAARIYRDVEAQLISEE